MSERSHSTLRPDDRTAVPRVTSERAIPERAPWHGKTYYGRQQLKPAPFNNWVVGGYIFLAGLSGSSSILGVLNDGVGGAGGDRIGARSRYLGLLGPTLGSALLVWDLHTPKRFYNMLRVAKATSPMSIGTWILMGYSAAALPSAAAQLVADRRPDLGWAPVAARVAQVPAAIAGMGLSVYTAALLSATSTPLWAAAPRSLAVRFGASSLASGGAALAIGGGSGRGRPALTAITMAALVVETAAAYAQDRQIRRKGIADAKRSGWGRAETLLVLGVGTALPLGLFALARTLKTPRHQALAADAASAAVLVGSAVLRTAVMAQGDASAARPEISFRFAAPDNLPKDVAPNEIPATTQKALPYPAG